MNRGIDLDGDNRNDHVLFACYSAPYGYGFLDYDRFVLEVNRQMMVSRGDNLEGMFSIVDIDTTDSYMEIAVPEAGQSSDFATYFYYYTGDLITFMGRLPGTCKQYDVNEKKPHGIGYFLLDVDGSGEVRTRRRGRILHTWFYPARYKLDEKHRLEFVEEEFYIMDSPVTLLSELALQASPTDSRTVVVLQVGDKATIVGSDDRKWCLVETEDGHKGWFAVESNWTIAGTGKEADEIFEGLCHAD